jgi:AraC-like DNA-binding protein
MVSLRCKMMVRTELQKLEIPYSVLELGFVETGRDLTPEEHDKLRINLIRSGLELLDDKKAILIEKIKNVIVELIHYSDEMPNINYSDYISEKLDHNYSYLSNIFSEVQGSTIEHFIIQHKIERVKELLLYDELNLTQISQVMNYSSVAHLSNQFKKVTGLTPTYFKKLKEFRKRVALENI